MKKCPFCSEEIQDTAIKCKHCKEWLQKGDVRVSGEEQYKANTGANGLLNTLRSSSPDDLSFSYIEKMPLCILVLLEGITFGIYYPVWFLKRKDAFNRFSSSEKIGDGLSIAAIVLFGLAVFSFFMSGFLEGNNRSTSQQFSVFGYMANLAGGIILIIMSFKGRRILNDHFNGYMHLGIPFSGVATFFLGPLYLQYKINRLK